MRVLSAGVLAASLCACDAVFPVGGGTFGGDAPGGDGVRGDANGADANDDAAVPVPDAMSAGTSRCSMVSAQFCADFDTPTTGLAQMALFAAPDPPATIYENPGGPASHAVAYVPGQAGSIAIAWVQLNTTAFVGEVWVWNYATVASGCQPYVLWVDFDPGLENRVLLSADSTSYTLWLQSTGPSGTALTPVSVAADPSDWNRIQIQIDAVNGQAAITIGSTTVGLIDADFSQAAGYTPVINIGAYAGYDGPECYAGFDDLEVYY